MKKILLIFSLLLTFTFVSARDSYSRDTNILPGAAKTIIDNNFKSKISFIKVDKTLGMITGYEVIMTDGCEIEFDKSGNWEDVEAPKNKSVPAYFVPLQISNYVKSNHSKQKIVSIEKQSNSYKIELTNGTHLKFDRAGNFLRYDD